MRPVEMEKGEKHNMLEFIKNTITVNGSRHGKFKCDCGNVVELSMSHVKSGHLKSCGCVKKNITQNATNYFSKGKRFNHLAFTGDFEKGEQGKMYGYFDCDCGNKNILIKLSAVKCGQRTTCGCLRMNKQAMAFTERQRLYSIWRGMKRRCYEENSKHYHNYGGRGISICNEWLNCFDNFVDWSILSGYSSILTIERVDNYGDYNPDNCTWKTMKEQHRNRRNNVVFTHDNETKCLDDWLEKFNVPRATYYNRVKAGMIEFSDLFSLPYACVRKGGD